MSTTPRAESCERCGAKDVPLVGVGEAPREWCRRCVLEAAQEAADEDREEARRKRERRR